MLTVGLIILALACITAVFKWRWALLICVIVALLQDPLRKLTPGAPVIYVGFVAIAFAAAYLGAYIANVRLSPSVIHGWHTDLKTPFLVFIAILWLQAIVAYLRFGNLLLPLIGAVFYVAPILAITFTHQLATRVGSLGIGRWMWLYVVASLLWFVAIYLEASGVRMQVLGEVGLGQIIYDVGAPSKANAGLYRAAEIAAWHVATTSCFLFMLLNGQRLSIPKTLIVVVVVLFLLYVGLATGRRKMLVQVVIFGSTYLFLHAWFLRGKAKLAFAAIVLGALMFGAVLAVVGPDSGEVGYGERVRSVDRKDIFEAWKDRGLTVFTAIPERFSQLGFLPVWSAVWDFGPLGAGLGAGAQGTQHFGGGVRLVGGTAEGGLGKLTLDLGLPGLLVFVWLLATIVRMIWQRLRALARVSRAYASIAFGFVGLLVANAATFSVATQAYGDVFILLTLGSCVGVLLALPAVAARDLGVVDPAARPAVTVPRPRGGLVVPR